MDLSWWLHVQGSTDISWFQSSGSAAFLDILEYVLFLSFFETETHIITVGFYTWATAYPEDINVERQDLSYAI